MSYDVSTRFATLERRIHGLEDTISKLLSRVKVLEHQSASQIPDEVVKLPVGEKKDGPFVYRKLDEERGEIRILVVYSGGDGDENGEGEVICELVHVGLEDGGEGQVGVVGEATRRFNTLSYTWGNVEKKKPVIIEGHQFPVTENLESALRRLRNFKDPSAKASSGVSRSFWWIDAICINQEDVLERNQQVNLMTRIYKKAAGVHIWLGEQADNSEIAFQVARQIADKTPRGPGHPEIVYPETTAEQRDIYRKAVAKLCARPWWERVWVRQEVAVANEATVHCGNESCSFHALTLTLDILNKIDEELGFKAIQEPIPNPKSDTDVLRTTAYRRAWILTYYRSNQGQGPTAAYQDLRTLILHTRSCQATDARDKVFSMLGLADPDFWGLKADYRLSITETFIAAARCLITKKQSLDILSGCQNPERRNGLPSWAPNLTDGWKARPFLTTGTRHCAEVMAGEPPDFVFKGEGDSILKARGFQLDVIETLSDETPHQDATNDELDALSAKWKALAATALSNPDIYVLDRGSISKYKDDGPWIEFLSIHVDRGHALPKAAAQLKVPGDYRMAKSLLLPSEEEVSVVDVKGVKNRVLEHLRKNGAGRRLGVTRMGKDKGSVVLVPADSVVGDEIWLFRGTNFPYVLRRRSEGEYVVVGETYSDRYYWPYLKAATMGTAETISII